MITSFFNKSNPPQAIVLFGLIIAAVLFYAWGQWTTVYALHLALLVVILYQHHRIASMFSFAHHNSFIEVFTVIFIALNIQAILSTSVLLAYVFLLVSMREYLALSSSERQVQKTFNAGFCIGIATLIYAPSLWSVFLFFAAMTVFEALSFRHLILALIGLFVPVLFHYSVLFLFDQPNVFFNTTIWKALGSSSPDFSWKEIAVFIIGGLATIRYFFSGLSGNNTEKSIRLIVFLSSLVFGTAAVFNSNSLFGSILFFAFPFSIALAYLLKTLTRQWQKELLLYGFLGWIAFQGFLG